MRISPNGDRLLLQFQERVNVFDLGLGADIAYITMPGPLSVMHMEFSPDGEQFVAATAHGTDGSHAVSIWDTASGRMIRGFGPPHGGRIHSLQYSPDGRLIAYVAKPANPAKDYMRSIFVMTPDGRRHRVVSSPAYHDGVPSWIKEFEGRE